MKQNLNTDNRSLPDVIGPWIGITPAPYDINQTKAEKLAHEIAASHQEIGGRTQEQADRSRLVSDLMKQYRRGDPGSTDLIFAAYQTWHISHHQMTEILRDSNKTPLQRMAQRFTI